MGDAALRRAMIWGMHDTRGVTKERGCRGIVLPRSPATGHMDITTSGHAWGAKSGPSEATAVRLTWWGRSSLAVAWRGAFNKGRVIRYTARHDTEFRGISICSPTALVELLDRSLERLASCRGVKTLFWHFSRAEPYMFGVFPNPLD